MQIAKCTEDISEGGLSEIGRINYKIECFMSENVNLMHTLMVLVSLFDYSGMTSMLHIK